MKHALNLVAIALLVAVAVLPSQAQTNPLVGTWKLNVAKSKYNPGPAPKSLTRTIEPQGDGVKYTFDGVAADGSAISYGFAVQFDGKDYPGTGSMPNGADSVTAKRTDANHYVFTQKKGDKVVGTSKVTVSEDGTSTTVDAQGTNAAGAKTHDIQVYDKQ